TLIILLSGFLFNVNGFSQKVYKDSDVSTADLRVYVTTDLASADLKVFEVESSDQARRDGQWYIVDENSQADAYIRLYITTNESEAQLKVYYVSDKEQTGWVTNNKRNLYKIGK
ncbi:MAG: hypothetical protein C0594_05095, partial [Marinilabiliales bacterium]